MNQLNECFAAQAIPSNFSRFKRGDLVIKQELNRLLELDQQHHSSRPLLTSNGRIRLRNPSTGTTEVGIQWSELLERAPQYFSLRYDRIRAREEYGKAVHGEIARIARQLATPPHLRNVT